MYSFDASAIIDLWANYPIQNPHFEPIWDWFKTKIEEKAFCISDVALEEVKHKILHNNLKEDILESNLFTQAVGI